MATTETVPIAFALFVLADGDPMKTAILAANLGGDCDTIGAIACSIAGGAYSGITAFPDEAVQIVEEVNGLDLKGVTIELLNRGWMTHSCN